MSTQGVSKVHIIVSGDPDAGLHGLSTTIDLGLSITSDETRALVRDRLHSLYKEVSGGLDTTVVFEDEQVEEYSVPPPV